MLVLKDIRNNNLYLVGKIDNKEYLLNGVCKFELTEKRSHNLIKVNSEQSVISEIIDRIKNHFPYDFNRIEFR